MVKNTLKDTQPEWTWDDWQQKVLDTDGNLALRCGRQTGKSEVISAKVAKLALEHSNINILMMAAAERQGSMIYEKVISNLLRDRGDAIFDKKPTKDETRLTNGTKIFCVPAGMTGKFIRGFTIHVLIVDEAAFVPEPVWRAITPMISIARKQGMGWIYLLSTPFGKGGFFYESFSDDDFTTFHISAEDCKRHDKAYLRKEKKRMTKIEYAQEYLAEFVDDWRQFFSTKLIKECMTFMEWNLNKDRNSGSRFYLGIDVARYGGHENAFSFVEEHNKRLKCVKVDVTDRVSTTDTTGRTLTYDQLWHFNKIGVDDSGIGGAVTDQLQEKLGKRRVLALNNASQRIQIQGEEKKRGIFKEDMYSNLLRLMESGKIDMINDSKLMRSLKSIIYEYTEGGNVKIFGNYSHITEALVRAVWCATKEKGLSLYIY